MLTAVLVMQIILLAFYAVNAVVGAVYLSKSNKRSIKDQAEHERRMAAMDAHACALPPVPPTGTGIPRDARVARAMRAGMNVTDSEGCDFCRATIERAKAQGLPIVVPCPKCGAMP